MLNKEYQQELSRLLLEHYQQLKLGKTCEIRKSYLLGFINAAEVMKVAEPKDTQVIMESVHLEVFGMTNTQRRASRKALKEALKNKDEEYFDVPPSMRNNLTAKLK